MSKIYMLLTTLLLTTFCYQGMAQAPGCATNVAPANMLTNVNPFPFITLKWTPVAGATSYDVYYSTKVPPKQFAGNVTSDSFNFIDAAYNTTYFWYVVPKNADGLAIGCVSNATSFTTSSPPPPPSNDNCNGAINLTSNVAGTTLGATESQAPVTCNSYTGVSDDDVWYEFTATKNGAAIITLSGNNSFDGVLEVFSGSCGSLTSLNCSDTSQSGGTEQITLNATAGTTYKIRVYGFDGDLASRGTFTISAVEAALPVTLVDFKAEQHDNDNVLFWKTANELNNVGFEIQSSNNGNTFEKIAFIDTRAANGNSSLLLSYQFVDAGASNGNTYYRLKQIDKNGHSSLSDIIFVKGNKINSMAFGKIYPNPVKNNLNLLIASPSETKIKIEIADLSGKLILSRQKTIVNGNNRYSIDVSMMAAGTYFIKASDVNKTQGAVSKFVKE
jgi:Secretion system C-terminal sorting domain/Bacterial pre-peptidase C-terminal domain